MTIMFSDMRGFTSISETYKSDPQGLTSLMNRFLTPLTNAILEETYRDEEIPEGHVEFDDYGPTLHVCGTADGLEHLRFDCFEHEPHYHYIRNHEQSNVICRIDDADVVERSRCPRFDVERAEHDTREARLVRRACAHHAWS